MKGKNTIPWCAVDPLIDIALGLSDEIAMLRTVHIALRNPEIGDLFTNRDCLEALELITDRVEKISDKANAIAAQIAEAEAR